MHMQSGFAATSLAERRCTGRLAGMIFQVLILKCALFQKITTKNVFGLHLIDYMTDILKQKDSELMNFKVREITAWSLQCFVSDLY